MLSQPSPPESPRAVGSPSALAARRRRQRRSRRLRIIGLISVALILAILALGPMAARWVVQRLLADRLERLSSASGLQISAGEIALEGMEELRIHDLAMASTKTLLTAGQIRVVADPWEVIRGSRRAREINIVGLHLDLSDLAPFTSLGRSLRGSPPAVDQPGTDAPSQEPFTLTLREGTLSLPSPLPALEEVEAKLLFLPGKEVSFHAKGLLQRGPFGQEPLSATCEGRLDPSSGYRGTVVIALSRPVDQDLMRGLAVVLDRVEFDLAPPLEKGPLPQVQAVRVPGAALLFRRPPSDQAPTVAPPDEEDRDDEEEETAAKDQPRPGPLDPLLQLFALAHERAQSLVNSGELALLTAFLPSEAILTSGRLQYQGPDDGEPNDLGSLDLTLRQDPENSRLHLSLTLHPLGEGSLAVDASLNVKTLSASLDTQMDDFSANRWPVLEDLFRLKLTKGTLSGKLQLRVKSALSHLSLQGNLSAKDLSLTAPWLSPQAVEEVDLEATVEAQVDPLKGELTAQARPLRINGLPINLDLEAKANEDGDKGPRLVFTLDTGLADGVTTLRAIPPGMMPDLAEGSVKGKWSLWFHLDIPFHRPKELVLQSKSNLRGLYVLSLGEQVQFDQLRTSFWRKYEYPKGKINQIRMGPETPSWVALDRIPPAMRMGVICQEDGGFYRHGGVSLFHIRGSLIRNLELGRFARGASTISMQLVKNLFLSPHKTISRKLQEIIITWQLEKHLTKDEILELYLNIIEFGPEIYGIKAGAEHYFGKEPWELNLAECAFLVRIVPSPKRYHKYRDKGRVPDYWSARLERLLKRVRDRGAITEEEFQAAAPYLPTFREEKGEGE